MHDRITAEAALARLFAHSRPPSFGAEEEAMALHPDTLDLLPEAERLLAALTETDRDRLKLELPAAQIEIIAPPCADIGELCRELAVGRRRLSGGVAGAARIASAGVHPFAASEGPLNRGEHYDAMEREYGPAARRELVCGLHVHVGISGAERTLAIYNALRGYLPDLAALGANAPIYGGRDSGMASVRPGIATLLPRQGVPPAFASVADLVANLAWGERAGRLRSGGLGWWWELRIHPRLGTLEVRVPDSQTTLADAAALVSSAVGLVLWLAARHDSGEALPVAETWRIAENRWSAARHGVHGEMIDLLSGDRVATQERLHSLLEEIEPFVAPLGGSGHLRHARGLVEANGADRQRAVAAQSGPRQVAQWLADGFTDRGEG